MYNRIFINIYKGILFGWKEKQKFTCKQMYPEIIILQEETLKDKCCMFSVNVEAIFEFLKCMFKFEYP